MYEALIAHLRECEKLDPSNNTYKEAADAIEELSAYVRMYVQMLEELRKDGWYLQKMKMMTCGGEDNVSGQA